MNKSQFSLPEYKAPDTSQFINIHATKLRTYLDELRIDARYLDNQGLALEDSETPKKGRKIGLESLFILSAVSEKHITPDQLVEMDKDEAKQQLSSLITVIKQHPRFILLGDPGIGKSTFIQWFNYLLSYPTENAARNNVGPLLPLTLTARRLQFVEGLNCAKACSNDEFLDVLLKSMGPIAESLQQDECKQLIVHALARGQVLLMIDGVDEISSQQSVWLAESVKLFLEQYPLIRLVLTSRIVGFDHLSFWFPEYKEDRNKLQSGKASVEQLINMDMRVLDDDDSLGLVNLPPIFFLSPLDNNRRQAYIENWSKTYIPKKSQVGEFIQSLKRNCFATDYLNTLSRTPVLLTMICFVQLNLRVLPDGRAELYRRIVHTYLVGLDRARNVKAGFTYKNLPYDYEDIQFWIAKLAWLMQCGDLEEESLIETEREIPFKDCQDRITSITYDQLKEFFKAHIASVTGDKDTADNDAEQLIEFIKKRTGFLIPKGMEGNEEIFSFSHLSFQEYFAGYFITQYWQEWSAVKEELQKLQETLKWDTWQEVWQLAFEETKRRRQSAMLETLFNDSPSTPPEDLIKGIEYNTVNLLLIKILSNATLRFEPEVKKARLLECWKYANQTSHYSALTLFWANEEVLNPLLQPEQCTHLSLDHLSQSQLQEFLPRLAEFTLLTELSLSKQKINDISDIAKLANLTKLHLRDTQISDVSALAKLTKLTYLGLSNTQISDISVLAKLTKLTELHLSNTQISDISALAKLTNLDFLKLNDTQVSDISALAKLTNLDFLTLYDTQVSDISVLLQLDSLQILVLDKSTAKNQPEIIQQLKDKSVRVHIT